MRAGTEPLTTLNADWKLGAHRRVGERELRRLAVGRDVEHREHVGVVDHRAVGAGEAVAEEVLARLPCWRP